MYGCRSDTRKTISRRCIASVALVTFTLGNVGWPLDAGKAAGGKGRCAMTGEARCCCGLDRKKSSCGCFKAPVLGKTAGCCQKKRPAEKSAELVLKCDCNDSSFPGFVVSGQPRLASAFVEVPELTETSALLAAAPLAPPGGAYPPETPPPRPSVS
jgi:hypothetical protein